jgi:hypothetical protein
MMQTPLDVLTIEDERLLHKAGILPELALVVVNQNLRMKTTRDLMSSYGLDKYQVRVCRVLRRTLSNRVSKLE